MRVGNSAAAPAIMVAPEPDLFKIPAWWRGNCLKTKNYTEASASPPSLYPERHRHYDTRITGGASARPNLANHFPPFAINAQYQPCVLLRRPMACPIFPFAGHKSCKRSQGGVRFPTGGNGATRSPRALPDFGPEGQQIRLDSGADGIVRMIENGSGSGLGHWREQSLIAAPLLLFP